MDNVELKKVAEQLIALPIGKQSGWSLRKLSDQTRLERGFRLFLIVHAGMDKPYGYLIYGVKNGTHEIVGTDFYAKEKKKGNEELEMWLLNRLSQE